MSIVGFIFARGGSKGLPGKNVRLFGGKPLITWAVEQALAVPRIDRVIVSTDSSEIAGIAAAAGAEIPFVRPAALAQDKSPEWLAWRHALNFLRDTDGVLPTAMVSIPTTAPLRLPSDIDRCIDAFEAGGLDIVVTVTDAHRSPYFNMVQRPDDGTIGLVIPPKAAIAGRQQAPVVYDMTTVAYVARPEFVLQSDGVFEGRVGSVHIPPERAIDIDTLMDFQIAEFLLSQREPQP
jgi:N-acylneuraminate cytidylyltransferase